MEVEDPASASSHEERNERLARVRLFCMLGESLGLTLRVLDFKYRHPSLTIPEDAETAKGAPMLLMFAGPPSRARAALRKQELKSILKFIYTRLYPEDFSAVEEENVQYRKYLKQFYLSQCWELPEQVRTLNFAQVRARTASLQSTG